MRFDRIETLIEEARKTIARAAEANEQKPFLDKPMDNAAMAIALEAAFQPFEVSFALVSRRGIVARGELGAKGIVILLTARVSCVVVE